MFEMWSPFHPLLLRNLNWASALVQLWTHQSWIPAGMDWIDAKLFIAKVVCSKWDIENGRYILDLCEQGMEVSHIQYIFITMITMTSETSSSWISDFQGFLSGDGRPRQRSRPLAGFPSEGRCGCHGGREGEDVGGEYGRRIERV